MRINGGILGRAVTANIGGRYNAVDSNFLRKQTKTGSYLIDVVAVAGGGGAGGYDGLAGAGGGSGGCVSGTMEVIQGAVYSIGVGGEGGGGLSATSGAQTGGYGGINGGGRGGGSLAPANGGGGGGGGWTGIYKDFTFYFVAGGGAGGGGANEGGANGVPAAGGGKQYQGGTTTMTGGNGQYYGSDGGGGSGGGGGYLGGEGQAQLEGTTFQTSGGGNYTHPTVFNIEIKNGNDGATSGTGGATNVTTRFGYVAQSNHDGAGGYNSPGTSPGFPGNLTIRYFGTQRASGGTITNNGGYTYHHYGDAANAGTLLFIA